MDFDVVIIGAGIAGSVAALNLAPFQRVALIERHATPLWRIGESLPGAARRLLSDMGLLESFLADAHLPRHALHGAWGGSSPVVRDALADPDGHGWQIDRVKFERRLRSEAVRRGATLMTPATVVALERAESGWRVKCEQHGHKSSINGRLIIHAAGRGSRYLAPHGVSRRIHDKLSCTWIRSQGVALPAGIVQIEAEVEGWWYAAPIPDAAILAFHTDANLPAARAGRTMSGLLDRARRLPMLGRVLTDPRWVSGTFGYCAAHGAWLGSAVGEAWLAAGDAAIAFDPIAAQGLFNALYLGLAAAESAHRHLMGDGAALSQYDGEISAIREAYIARRAAWYGLETRWAGQPFWARRLDPAAVLSRAFAQKQDSLHASPASPARQFV